MAKKEKTKQVLEYLSHVRDPERTVQRAPSVHCSLAFSAYIEVFCKRFARY